LVILIPGQIDEGVEVKSKQQKRKQGLVLWHFEAQILYFGTYQMVTMPRRDVRVQCSSFTPSPVIGMSPRDPIKEFPS